MRPSVLIALGWLFAAWLGAGYAMGLTEQFRSLGRDAAELDDAKACALVRDFVGGARISCDGPLEVMGDVARLSSVKSRSETRTYCLARVGTWRVLRDTRSWPCFSTPPDAKAPLTSERARVGAEVRALIASRRSALLRAMAEGSPSPSCPAIEPVLRELPEMAPAIELARLEGEAEPGWAFLTHRQIAAGLDAESDEWLSFAPWEAGRFMLVITSRERSLPRVGGSLHAGSLEPFDFTRGSFDGEVTLVDVQRGVAVCSSVFSFASSASIAPKMTTLPTSGGGSISLPNMAPPGDVQLMADLKVNYQATLERTLKRMTKGRVSLLRD